MASQSVTVDEDRTVAESAQSPALDINGENLNIQNVAHVSAIEKHATQINEGVQDGGGSMLESRKEGGVAGSQTDMTLEKEKVGPEIGSAGNGLDANLVGSKFQALSDSGSCPFPPGFGPYEGERDNPSEANSKECIVKGPLTEANSEEVECEYSSKEAETNLTDLERGWQESLLGTIEVRFYTEGSMKLILWNVRGLGGDGKAEMVKRIRRNHNGDFVGFIETKKQHFDRGTILKLWGGCSEISWD
ncbi:hypothetical protein PIB30_068757 [Stylosanthes scabra]|uniref:Uncharacterized protein n=1 Tax=Stylosanthes scabra TaxID=79078 RepID=A0ABU6WQT1_9FABA|nr:hypothetical protein [Stylosanthes scabra]